LGNDVSINDAYLLFLYWLNYTSDPHFRSKIWIWSLNSFLSQSGSYFGKFDAIKSFSLVV